MSLRFFYFFEALKSFTNKAYILMIAWSLMLGNEFTHCYFLFLR
jgi:hypothetical protein